MTAMQKLPNILFFLLIFLVPASGSSQGINARIFFDRTEIQIGEQVLFHIQVSKPLEAKVFLPLLTDTLDWKIEILQAFPVDSVVSDNKVTITGSYLVTCFYPGIHDVEPMTVAFEFMGLSDTLFTGFGSLSVSAPEIDESRGIYDIKPPLAVPVGFWEILPWFLFIFWFLAGIYVLLWFLRWKRVKPEQEQIKIIETAHELALKELAKLREAKLWQNHKFKEYYTRLTGILRKYLENRYGIKALESTSNEIMTDLGGIMRQEEKDLELMREILQTADMVKFAKFRPEEAVNNQCLDYAIMFVLETRYEIPVLPDNREEAADVNKVT